MYLHTAEEGICEPSTLYNEAFLKASLILFAV